MRETSEPLRQLIFQLVAKYKMSESERDEVLSEIDKASDAAWHKGRDHAEKQWTMKINRIFGLKE